MLEANAQTQAHFASHIQIPGPRGRLLTGSLHELRHDLLTLYMDAWRTYGDIVRFRLGPTQVYLIVHPDYIQQVLQDNKDKYCKGSSYETFQKMLGTGLATSEGALWERERRLIQPMFVPRQVGSMLDVMSETAAAMLERWQRSAETGEVLQMGPEMMRVTMSIIARTMFSIDISDMIATTAPALRTVIDFLYRRVISIVRWPLALPLPAHRRFHQSMHILDTIVYGLIEDRRRDSQPRNDLLDMFLRAQDAETGESMSDKQVRDEVLTIFFAGHETTANALTWTWYLLSQHPEVEAGVHAEVDQVLAGRAPTYADLAELKYTKMVIDEAIRLYPPVYIIARQTVVEDVIGGYRLPPGSMVTISKYVTHRHTDFWEDPERFDPERFTPERSKARAKYAYIPFGAGPRRCIGYNFATMEAQLIIAMVAQRYKLRLVPGHPVKPKAAATLQPYYGLPMTLHPR